MIDRITPRTSPNPYYDLDFVSSETNVDEYSLIHQAADAEVASLYYQSSISSLAESKVVENTATTKVTSSQTQKTWFSKSKDWLWSLFGIKQDVSVKAEGSENDDPIDNGVPRLNEPGLKDQKRMLRTIADQDLVHRLKDIAEFEQEMLTSGSNSLDKLIFLQLIACSLFQKELKEEETFNNQMFILNMHERNKKLRDTKYVLADEIQKLNDSTKILHWTNIGLTGAIVGTMAAAFATGGGSVLMNIGMGMLSLGKGGVTLASGITRKKADHETGELFMVGQEHKHNAREIDDEMGLLVGLNEEVGELLKTIRKHLDNQSRVERSFFGHNS